MELHRSVLAPGIKRRIADREPSRAALAGHAGALAVAKLRRRAALAAAMSISETKTPQKRGQSQTWCCTMVRFDHPHVRAGRVGADIPEEQARRFFPPMQHLQDALVVEGKRPRDAVGGARS